MEEEGGRRKEEGGEIRGFFSIEGFLNRAYLQLLPESRQNK